jgi:hypothetical protein
MSSEPFRSLGGGHSPTMARLAEEGESRRRELPREAVNLSDDERTSRLEHAFRTYGHDASGWGLFTMIVGFCSFGITVLEVQRSPRGVPFFVFAWVGTFLLLGYTIWLGSKREKERKRKVSEGLRWATELSFPVEGYDLWLLSEEPLLDVTLQTPLATPLASALHAVNPAIEAEPLDDTTTRVLLPPRKAQQGETTLWIGDQEAFRAVVAKVLEPLHQEIGIARVTMGGRMHRR